MISPLTEVVMALPGTVLLLAVIGIIGNNLYIVMVVMGLLISAVVYRVMLGVAQSVRQRLYVDAARVNGLGSLRVNLVHVLPSMGTVVAVQAAQLYGIGLVIVAGLAFLGFGPAEPEPNWGFMIQDASGHLFDAPWLMVPTGLVLALTVIAANELADAIAGKAAADERRIRRKKRAAAVPHSAQPPAAAAETAPADPNAVLQVSGLSIAVNDGPALVTDVSFSLHQGKVLGLVGESGCGKTMTARSLMGLLPPGVSVSGGSITWQGRELVGLSEKKLDRYPRPGDRDDLPGADGGARPDVFRRLPAHPADPSVPQGRPRRGQAHRGRAAQQGRHRRRRASAEELPAPAVRRYGTTGLHRAGADR